MFLTKMFSNTHSGKHDKNIDRKQYFPNNVSQFFQRNLGSRDTRYIYGQDFSDPNHQILPMYVLTDLWNNEKSGREKLADLKTRQQVAASLRFSPNASVRHFVHAISMDMIKTSGYKFLYDI